MTKKTHDKIAEGLKEALAVARGEEKPARVTVFKFVLNDHVEQYERVGWIALDGLIDTPHGQYSTLMQWIGEGEPVVPLIRKESSNAH